MEEKLNPFPEPVPVHTPGLLIGRKFGQCFALLVPGLAERIWIRIERHPGSQIGVRIVAPPDVAIVREEVLVRDTAGNR